MGQAGTKAAATSRRWGCPARPGADTGTHTVYFGTEPSPPLIQNQTGTSFDPGGMLPSTVYYWRIDESKAFGTTTGDDWFFITGTGTVTDTVTITKAEWRASRQQLKVEATSSDQPSVTLTVVGHGVMSFKRNKYKLDQRPVPSQVTVTVTSSGGGSDTRTVKIR